MKNERPHFLLFSDSQRSSSASTNESSGNWRFVLESLDGETNFAVSDTEPETSPERLALLSVVRGLESLDQPSRVTLLTTSRYVSRGLRFGLPQWRENRWQWEDFGRTTPVDHADLWRRVDRAMRIHQVNCRLWRVDPPESTAVPAAGMEPGSEPAVDRSHVAESHVHAPRVSAPNATAPGRIAHLLARVMRASRAVWQNTGVRDQRSEFDRHRRSGGVWAEGTGFDRSGRRRRDLRQSPAHSAANWSVGTGAIPHSLSILSMQTISVRPLSAWFRVALVAVVVGLAGCATLPPAPEAELPSSNPDWSSARPAASPRSELSGLSDRSREIERNLGIR